MSGLLCMEPRAGSSRFVTRIALIDHDTPPPPGFTVVCLMYLMHMYIYKYIYIYMCV